MGLCDAAVCCDSWSDSVCPSADANLTLQLAKASHTITEPLPCFMVGKIKGIAALSPTLCHS